MDFSRKVWKNVEKSENNLKASYIAEKRPKLMNNKKNNIFYIFSGNYGKMSKKVKNDEKGSYISEKGHNWWKIRKIILFGFFQEGIKNVEKSEK